MKKLTIKNIIEFRCKSDRGKKNFANDLKLNKVKPKPESGGDYWISAVSAIAKAYKENNSEVITKKIEEVKGKLKTEKHPPTKAQYTRNIDVLHKYEKYDFKKWTPLGKIGFLKNHRVVLSVRDLLVESSPHHVFSFTKDNLDEVGAIWLIAKKDGYKKEELGMFTDILFRYLKNQFGKAYTVNPRYCIALDVVEGHDVNYSQLQKGEIPVILNKTVDEIKKLM